MTDDTKARMSDLVEAHAAMDRQDIAWLRTLSMAERSALIESACEAAAELRRSRLAAGLPDVEPAPWPASTWEFLKEHAARARS
jgi:hypothetical protein